MPNLDRETAVKANVFVWEAGQGLGVEQVPGTFKISRKTVGDQEVHGILQLHVLCLVPSEQSGMQTDALHCWLLVCSMLSLYLNHALNAKVYQ